MQKLKSYHGIWWYPVHNDLVGLNESFGEFSLTDTGGYQLELFRHPGGCLQYYHRYNVLWGKDSHETPITLFGVWWVKDIGGADATFHVRYALIGIHILSLDEPRFKSCIARFPYLQNWTCVDMRCGLVKEERNVVEIDPATINKHFSVEVSGGLSFEVSSKLTWNALSYSAETHNDSSVIITSPTAISIRDCLNEIGVFSKFLSLALYLKQSPSRIGLMIEGYPYSFEFLFSKKESKSPGTRALLPMKQLSGKLPRIFSKWYDIYEDISPICSSLLNSLQSDEFDFSDFLIVAQALDGYSNRFGQSQKKGQIYIDAVSSLVTKFNDVEAVNKCTFDIETIRDTRNHYAHLLPNGKKKNVANGRELLLLTAKCKILLACCILDELGLSKEEINICCKHSGLLIDASAICDEEEIIGRPYKEEIEIKNQ